MKHEPTAKNCWAPEIYYDEETETFLICWATTIPGRFPETEREDDDNNHRMYHVATKDFKTYTDTALFFEPGFNVIDTFIIKDRENKRYAMFLRMSARPPSPKRISASRSPTRPPAPTARSQSRSPAHTGPKVRPS